MCSAQGGMRRQPKQEINRVLTSEARSVAFVASCRTLPAYSKCGLKRCRTVPYGAERHRLAVTFGAAG